MRRIAASHPLAPGVNALMRVPPLVASKNSTSSAALAALTKLYVSPLETAPAQAKAQKPSKRDRRAATNVPAPGFSLN